MEEGVDRRFQGAGVPLDLGEQKAALERGEEGDGQGVRVGAVRELPGLVQAAQAFADGALPLPEAAGQQGPGVRVGLRELAGEEPRGQPPLASPLLAWAITMSRQARSPAALPRSACR